MQTVESRSMRSLPVAIYVSSAAIVAAFLGLSLFVLYLAGGIADRVRLEAETQLVGHELDRQIQTLARDQAQISHWDDTVDAIGDTIDPEFVRDEIADWLWEDFGIEMTVVISADGAPRVAVEQNRVLDPGEGEAFAAFATDLVDAARQLYFDKRRASPEGYVIAGNPLAKPTQLFVSGIRPVKGRMGFIVAQAIVPDHAAISPDASPHVLLTFKPISPDLLETMGATLGLAEFRIATGETALAELVSMPLGDTLDGKPVVMQWRTAAPSEAIWRLSALPVLVLLAIVAGVLVFLARRSSVAVSALEISERQNRFLALHDALTGLPNRLQFDRVLEDVIEKGHYDRCAILCIDLDRFKAVNDTYGHHAGDVVIKTVAKRIAEEIGKAGIAARIGGDEFIVLLYNELDRDSVLWRCDRLIETVCEPVRFEGGEADVGASIGVAWWPDDALTAKAVIRSADEALYRAKQLGRGRACCAELPKPADPETDSKTHAA